MRCLNIALKDISAEQKVILGYLTYHSGKLYNQALYLLKHKQAKINMFDLYNKLRFSLHLRSLQSRCAQIVLGELVTAYKNWLAYLANPQKFKGQEIRAPRFRSKKRPHRTITFDRTGFRIEGARLRLSISQGLKKWLKEKHGICAEYVWIDTGVELKKELVRNIQIVPKGDEFEVHIIYEHKNVAEHTTRSGEKIMTVDPNSGNFMVVGIEGVKTPYIVDGRGLKSLLRKYLKRIAKLQSLKDNLKNKKLPHHRVEQRIRKLWLKIERLLRHYAHTVSNLLLELAFKHNVGRIYLGNAPERKNKESKLSSIVEQMWHLLPHGKVKDYLTYKCSQHRIKVDYISERYTSGVDSTIPCGVTKENYTPGARIKRGLFCACLGFLNADVNAVRNCLKKLGKFDLETGLGKPVRLRIFYRLKGSSAVLLYGSAGRSRGGVNPPAVIRPVEANSREASYL